MVIHDLLMEGFDVFRDVTDSCSTDIIVVKDQVFTRVQIKTVSTSTNGSVTIKLFKPCEKSWVRYCGDEFDVLALHVLDRKITLYLKLSELLATGNKSMVTFRMTSSTSTSSREHEQYTSFHRCLLGSCNHRKVANELDL